MNQRDIAKLAGVSSATISRVINNDPRVSKKTSEHVRKVIREHGYVQNAMARNLRMANTKTIGYLVPEIKNPVFPAILAGFQEMLFKKGYDLIFENTDENSEKESKAINTLMRYRVDGLLAVPVHAGGTMERFESFDIPIVFIDRKPDGKQKHDSLLVDNIGGMHQIIEYLASLGHTNIATLYGTDITPGRERLQGFRTGMQNAGLPVREEYIVPGYFSEQGGYEATEKLLSMKNRPTAIIPTNNMSSIGAFKALVDHGVKMPQEMALAGFDDFPLAAHLTPPVTVVRRATTEMGRLAAEMLLERIEKGRPEGRVIPPRTVILSTELVVRGSCMNRNDMTV